MDDPARPVSTARDELLDTVMTQVARRGLSDVSLRELAADVGTSHRMLLYHFGSREGLVAAIVERMEARQRDALGLLARTETTPRSAIEAQWAQLTDPTLRPFVALFFEVLALALHDRPGTEGFLESLTDPWLALAEGLATAMGQRPDRDELRLGVAVSRGLLVEVLASGEVEPATRSLHRFLDMWELTGEGGRA